MTKMRDALYGVLPRRALALAVPLLITCVAGTSLANAATPRPVRASSLIVVKKRASSQPKELGLDVLEARLTIADGGVPVVISCDTPGVPSPIDGHTLAKENDGQVWRVDPDDPSSPIRNVVHVSTDTCWAAQTTNRHRDPNPTAFFTYHGQRVDQTSGAALEVLLHESLHVSLQSADEGLVDCTAYRNAWALARQFGLPAWEAHMLLVGIQWRHAVAVGDEYHTVC